MLIRTIATAALLLALSACSDARQAQPSDEASISQPATETPEPEDCGCKRQPIKRLANPITPKSE